MKLDWMRLSNFRQFYGDQDIRFSRDSSRNVTVITESTELERRGCLPHLTGACTSLAPMTLANWLARGRSLRLVSAKAWK